MHAEMILNQHLTISFTAHYSQTKDAFSWTKLTKSTIIYWIIQILLSLSIFFLVTLLKMQIQIAILSLQPLISYYPRRDLMNHFFNIFNFSGHWKEYIFFPVSSYHEILLAIFFPLIYIFVSFNQFDLFFTLFPDTLIFGIWWLHIVLFFCFV